MCGSRGGGGGAGGPDPPENHKNIGFLSNSGPDSLKNYEATEPALNIGPSSARQRADDGPLIVQFGSANPSTKKKNVVKNGPPQTKLSGSTHADINLDVVFMCKILKKYLKIKGFPYLWFCVYINIELSILQSGSFLIGY